MLLNEGEQPELSEVGPAAGLVHVTSSGVPPGPSAVPGRGECPLPRKSAIHQLCRNCSRPLPVTPQDAAQFAPQPLIELLEDAFHLGELEGYIDGRES